MGSGRAGGFGGKGGLAVEKLSFQTAEMEGPLDLILSLLAKHKLNIQDIEIFALVDQYLAAVEKMGQDMEVASEFLEMAARLVHMKTVSLLPRHAELEELRQELTGQLLEYQACKAAALLLREQNQMGERFVRKTMEIPMDLAYHLRHSPQLLLAAYGAAMGKGLRRLPPPTEVFSQLVTRPMVSVSSRIIFILRRLYRGGRMPTGQLFSESRERSQLVATFLALLELMKGGRVRVSEDGGEISLQPRAGDTPIFPGEAEAIKTRGGTE